MYVFKPPCCEKVLSSALEVSQSTDDYGHISQTQSLDPRFVPIFASEFLAKKTDYAWNFSSTHPTTETYIRSMRAKDINLSPLTDGWTKQLPLFSGIEVKRVNDEQMAKGQLGIFVSATLRHRRNLLKLAGRLEEEKSKIRSKIGRKDLIARENAQYLEEPLLGWTACGHYWCFYLAWLTQEEHTVSSIIPACDFRNPEVDVCTRLALD